MDTRARVGQVESLLFVGGAAREVVDLATRHGAYCKVGNYYEAYKVERQLNLILTKTDMGVSYVRYVRHPIGHSLGSTIYISFKEKKIINGVIERGFKL
jgi:hypothetical protein